MYLLSKKRVDYALCFHSFFTFAYDEARADTIGGCLRAFHDNIEEEISKIFGIRFISADYSGIDGLKKLIENQGPIMVELSCNNFEWIPRYNITNDHVIVIESIKDDIATVVDPTYSDKVQKIYANNLKITKMHYMNTPKTLVKPDKLYALILSYNKILQYNVDLQFEIFKEKVSLAESIAAEYSSNVSGGAWVSDLDSMVGYIISGSRYLYTCFIENYVGGETFLMFANEMRELETAWKNLKNNFLKCVLWGETKIMRERIIQKIDAVWLKEKKCLIQAVEIIENAM